MDKEKQKKLITEIMNEDAKHGLYKKQTVVQWLYHKLQSECLIDMADDIFEQAKQMEREQIEAAYNQGYRDGDIDGCIYGDKDISNYSDANQYYTQTYGE